MRKILIVGNWKMHLNTHQSSLLLRRLHQHIKIYHDIEIVLAPSMLSLQPLSLQIDRRKFRLAAQNGFYVDEGAYTGEVSFAMLRDLIHYSIIGHSERRIHFHEDLEMVRDKVEAAIRNDIGPILCIGETRQERRAGETKRVLHDQLTTALSNLTSDEIDQVVIAYEPVWAIGVGDPAKPSEITDAIQFIRYEIEELYGKKAAESVRVLYGASVEAEFVSSILSIPGVDGLLVGGASINYYKFNDIVSAAERLQHERKKQEAKE